MLSLVRCTVTGRQRFQQLAADFVVALIQLGLVVSKVDPVQRRIELHDSQQWPSVWRNCVKVPGWKWALGGQVVYDWQRRWVREKVEDARYKSRVSKAAGQNAQVASAVPI